MPDDRNRRMQRRLLLMRRCYPFVAAVGDVRRGSQAHLLVSSDPHRIRFIAQRFRQNAIVTVQQRHPVTALTLHKRA